MLLGEGVVSAHFVYIHYQLLAHVDELLQIIESIVLLFLFLFFPLLYREGQIHCREIMLVMAKS